MNIQEFLNAAKEWIVDPVHLSWILVGLTFFLIIFFIVLCVHGGKIRALRKDYFLHINYHSTAHDCNEDNDKKEDNECLCKYCNVCKEDEGEPTKDFTTLEAKVENAKPVVVLEPEVTPEQINQEEELFEDGDKEDIPEENISEEDVIEPEAVKAAEPVTLESHEEIKEGKPEVTVAHKKNDYYDLPLAKLNAVEEALGLKKSKTKANATLNIKYTLANKKVTKTQVLAALDALSMYHLTAKENKETLINSLIKLLNK